ncbi:MAG TPA: GH25 family lysozyme [Alphaproteobacteria bacterium]|nr:GH25 family lysozyme [Alphaproteobacteria bacterium]
MYISGIDVSHYQGDVDWQAVAASGVHFAFIKATGGVDDVDPRFGYNWAAAGAAGVLRGAYHFFRPSCDAKDQARLFCSVVTLDDAALPPALDVEVTEGVDPPALRAGIKAWLEAVEATLACKPVLYTDPSFWRTNGSADFGAYPLWLACYSASPELPEGWPAWTFWQHSDAGQVPGIVGAVDLNYCAASYEDLQRMRSSLSA